MLCPPTSIVLQDWPEVVPAQGEIMWVPGMETTDQPTRASNPGGWKTPPSSQSSDERARTAWTAGWLWIKFVARSYLR